MALDALREPPKAASSTLQLPSIVWKQLQGLSAGLDCLAPPDGSGQPQTIELTVQELRRSLAHRRSRERLGAHELSRGANAIIWIFEGGHTFIHVPLPTPRAVRVEALVIKRGRWASAASFWNEVDMQQRAADAGLAPFIYHAALEDEANIGDAPLDASSAEITREPGGRGGAEEGTEPRVPPRTTPQKSRAPVVGLVVMQRLTTPTYFRWYATLRLRTTPWRGGRRKGSSLPFPLHPHRSKGGRKGRREERGGEGRRRRRGTLDAHTPLPTRDRLFWLTKAERRKAGILSQHWSIDREALAAPAARAWAAETRRLKEALLSAGIEHGDWHERNLVFDVPEAHALAFAPGVDHKVVKHAIEAAIADGPASGRARLYVIDYGSARLLRSQLDRTCACLCWSKRLVDPTEEPPSHVSRQIT